MKESLSILFISARADHGGGPKHMLDLMKECKILHPSWKLFLACPDEAPYGKPLRLQAERATSIPHRFFSVLALIRILRILFQENIDVVHSHGRGAGVYSRLIKIFFPRFRVVHTFHGFHKTPGLKGNIKLWIDQILARFADHYISVSSSERELLQVHGCLSQIRTTVVMNGVRIPEKIQEKKYTAQLGMLARLDYQKGMDRLLEYLKALHQQNPKEPWKFLLAGFPRELLTIPDELKDRMQLLGELPNSQELFEKIDLFVSTSRWEGFPLTVLEAMAWGVPTLLSNVPGNSYFIENEMAAGYSLDNEGEFISQLRHLLESTELRDQLRARAFEFVSRRHRVQLMAEQTARIYQQVAT